MIKGRPRFDIGFGYCWRWSRRCRSEMAEVVGYRPHFVEPKAQNDSRDIITLYEVLHPHLVKCRKEEVSTMPHTITISYSPHSFRDNEVYLVLLTI